MPNVKSTETLSVHFSKMERQEWGLWSTAVTVTLLLTGGLASFAFPVLNEGKPSTSLMLPQAVRGLLALVLIFDIYMLYQQLQIQRIRRTLVQREELFRLISENAADLIAVVDMKGNRIYNSLSYEKVLGYSSKELSGSSSFEQIHPEDKERVKEAAEQARRTGTGLPMEYRIRHKNGTWRTLESTASIIRNSRNEPDRLVVVNRDVTERRVLERQLRMAQKMEAIGRLSGGIAHDFNNLLGVIIGYIQVMKRNLVPGQPMHEYAEEIEKASQRAVSLTRQLLAFSRQQILEPVTLNLNTLVIDMEKMLPRLIGEDVQLHLVLDPAICLVKADPGQIEQVVMNLTVNARDAMPDGGKLTIQTANAELDASFVHEHPGSIPGQYAMLAVMDTGTGMDPETQARMFEPFFTTKARDKGTGLGLATVYGVVKQSNGYIAVESEKGKGASFKIYLPRTEQTAAIPSETFPAPLTTRGNETILLVEDAEPLRKLAQMFLKNNGYQVLTAADGVEAQLLASQTARPIHLLLTDVVMPGINGRVLAERLATSHPSMKVLYVSGYTDSFIADHGVLEEGIYLLHKPFTEEALMHKVREVLDASTGAKETNSLASKDRPVLVGHDDGLIG